MNDSHIDTIVWAWPDLPLRKEWHWPAVPPKIVTVRRRGIGNGTYYGYMRLSVFFCVYCIVKMRLLQAER